MKVTSHLINPVPAAAAQSDMRNRRPTDAPPAPAPSVTSEISSDGREKVLTDNGKNAASPAQRAREGLSDYTNLGHRHFGRLVSAIAREASAPEEAPTEGTGAATGSAIPPVIDSGEVSAPATTDTPTQEDSSTS